MILGGDLPTSTIPAWACTMSPAAAPLWPFPAGRPSLADSIASSEFRKKTRPGHREMTSKMMMPWFFTAEKKGYHGISWYIHELMGLESILLNEENRLIMAYHGLSIFYLVQNDDQPWDGWGVPYFQRNQRCDPSQIIRQASQRAGALPASFLGQVNPRRMVVKSPSEITNEMDGNHD